MKIETNDSQGSKLTLEIKNDLAIIEIDDGATIASFNADIENIDFLASNLKRMSNKIKKGAYECDSST